MIGDKKLIGQQANEREGILVCKLLTSSVSSTSCTAREITAVTPAVRIETHVDCAAGSMP